MAVQEETPKASALDDYKPTGEMCISQGICLGMLMNKGRHDIQSTKSYPLLKVWVHRTIWPFDFGKLLKVNGDSDVLIFEKVGDTYQLHR